MPAYYYLFRSTAFIFLTLVLFDEQETFSQSLPKEDGTLISSQVSPDSTIQSSQEIWQPVDTTLQHTNQHLDTLQQDTDLDAAANKVT